MDFNHGSNTGKNVLRVADILSGDQSRSLKIVGWCLICYKWIDLILDVRLANITAHKIVPI